MSCSFAALGLEPTATEAEVKAAYRLKARSLHPDAGGDPAEFSDLNHAYTEALLYITNTPCTMCHGTGKVQQTTGWTTISLPCPLCG